MKMRGIAIGMMLGAAAMVGCEAKKPAGNAGSTSVSKTDSHDHGSHDDHDHDHDQEGEDEHPEHGPHGGHIAHFETSPTTHFEWAHDDEKGVLTLYFEELVSAGAKIELAEVQVSSDGSQKSFKLEPAADAKIEGSIFQIQDAELLTLIGASGTDPKGVQAKLSVVIDGKKESLLLKDDHHHH